MKLRQYIQQTLIKWTRRTGPLDYALRDRVWALLKRYEDSTGLWMYDHDDITDEAGDLSRQYDDIDDEEKAFQIMLTVPLEGPAPWFLDPLDLRQAMTDLAEGGAL